MLSRRGVDEAMMRSVYTTPCDLLFQCDLFVTVVESAVIVL
jgi:hypothetical protein